MDTILYRPEQAANLLNVSRTTIFALMGAGEIRSISIGRRRRISVQALHEFVERRTESAASDGLEA